MSCVAECIEHNMFVDLKHGWCTHVSMTAAGMYHIATLLSTSKLSLCMYPSFIRFCRCTDNLVALVILSQPCEDFLA